MVLISFSDIEFVGVSLLMMRIRVKVEIDLHLGSNSITY